MTLGLSSNITDAPRIFPHRVHFVPRGTLIVSLSNMMDIADLKIVTNNGARCFSPTPREQQSATHHPKKVSGATLIPIQYCRMVLQANKSLPYLEFNDKNLYYKIYI